MERLPAPEITIEGGQGWQLGGPQDAPPAPDALASGDDAPQRAPRGGRWGPLALAAALGFGVATVLADVRQDTVAETAAGVLSLELRPEPENIGRSLLRTEDGRLAVSTSAVLRNTGPEPIGLQRLELVGTPYRSDDLAGRRVVPDQQSVVALLRPVDCEDLRPTGAPGPLRVHATTGAGTRTVDLRLTTDVLALHDEQVRSACGQADALSAAVVIERASSFGGSTAIVTAELSNGSSRPLRLRDVRAAAGLRVVRVQDADGRPHALPLPLPPGDYDPPVELFEGRGEAVTVAVVLEVADCSRLQPRRGSELYVPLVEGVVDGDADRAGASTSWGTDPAVVERLAAASCPPAAAAAPLRTLPLEQQRQEQGYDPAD